MNSTSPCACWRPRSPSPFGNSRLYTESQQASKIRDTLFSIASHGLKIPSTPLRMQVESLTRNLRLGRLDEKQKGVWAHRDEVQTDPLNGLLYDLLNLFCVENGGITLKRDAVDLAEVVNNVVHWCQKDLERTKCTVKTSYQSITGQFDRARLQQVVTNILLNATKYAKGIRLELRVYQEGNAAVLEEAYDGPGIATRYQKTTFNRFARGEARPNVGDLGLGLFVCLQVVGAHGGQNSVASDMGQASTFEVALPLAD